MRELDARQRLSMYTRRRCPEIADFGTMTVAASQRRTGTEDDGGYHSSQSGVALLGIAVVAARAVWGLGVFEGTWSSMGSLQNAKRAESGSPLRESRRTVAATPVTVVAATTNEP